MELRKVNRDLRYTVLPMDLSPSSDEFNRPTDKAITGLKGIKKSVNDMLAYPPMTMSWRRDLMGCSPG